MLKYIKVHINYKINTKNGGIFMSILKGLNPEKVLGYFEELTKIPHGSGNEKVISDYLANFGKERGFVVIQDDELNVIIKKPATQGYENAQG